MRATSDERRMVSISSQHEMATQFRRIAIKFVFYVFSCGVQTLDIGFRSICRQPKKKVDFFPSEMPKR